ncbi:MAG: family 20 glycosylhydrolase, partial [Thermoguttaceae bacterium]
MKTQISLTVLTLLGAFLAHAHADERPNILFILTDDQGWRMEILKYPRLTEIGSIRKSSPPPGKGKGSDHTPYGPFFYTQKELRDLIAYAKDRHVTIIPEIDLPGHSIAALAAYPEYSCAGGPFEVERQFRGTKDVFCAGNEATYTFLENILDEVMDVFPSKFIHIGGDEVSYDRWKKCPKC